MSEITNQPLHSSADAASDHVRINLYMFPNADQLMLSAYSDKYPFRKWMLENDVYWYNFPDDVNDAYFRSWMWADVSYTAYREYWYNMDESAKATLIASWENSPVVQHENAFMFWPNPLPNRRLDLYRCPYKWYTKKDNEKYHEVVAYYEKISKIQAEYIRSCDLQVFLIFSFGSALTTLHQDIMYSELSKHNCVTKEIYIPGFPANEQHRRESLKEKFPNAIILSEWKNWALTQKPDLLTFFKSQDTLLPLLMNAIDELKRDYLRTRR